MAAASWTTGGEEDGFALYQPVCRGADAITRAARRGERLECRIYSAGLFVAIVLAAAFFMLNRRYAARSCGAAPGHRD